MRCSASTLGAKTMKSKKSSASSRGIIPASIFALLGIIFVIEGLRGHTAYFWHYANSDQPSHPIQLIAGGSTMIICSAWMIWVSTRKTKTSQKQ